MKYLPGWSSHYPILVKVLENTSGDVLELGMGPFSTPLMHWLCEDQKRILHSYDNDLKYMSLNRHFETPTHKIFCLEDWNTADIDREWGVAFIDHKPAKRRRDEIKRLHKLAKIVIVHDTDPETDKFYRYNGPFSMYKYRYDYKLVSPNTTVLSNFDDLTFLKNWRPIY